jgi:hypothetical protein
VNRPPEEGLDPQLPAPAVDPPEVLHPDEMDSLSPGILDESGALRRLHREGDNSTPTAAEPEAREPTA